METLELRAEVPLELLRLARERYPGGRHLTIAHLVRAGLAALAGEDIDVADFTPRRGRPRKAANQAEDN